MWSTRTRCLVDFAVAEDLSDLGDLSAALLPDPERGFSARLVSRRAGVVCGLELAPDICTSFSRRLARNLTWSPAADLRDGHDILPGQVVATLEGSQAAVLSCERTLLNFLGRMSGVATLTRQYVETARSANPAVCIRDTRKTIPGWRELDKYSVRCGGGMNHRMGLYDAILIKDNHLAGVGVDQLGAHVRRLLEQRAACLPPDADPREVEVEVDGVEQLRAIANVPGIDVILLDNFGIPELRQAVEWHRSSAGPARSKLEASGNVSLATVGPIAATGVDYIAVGALTHSAAVLDLGLDA